MKKQVREAEAAARAQEKAEKEAAKEAAEAEAAAKAKAEADASHGTATSSVKDQVGNAEEPAVTVLRDAKGQIIDDPMQQHWSKDMLQITYYLIQGNHLPKWQI